MPLPQDITPFNLAMVDTHVKAGESDWIVESPSSSMKVLYTAPETGTWAVLLRWKKGYIAPQHKHLSGAHAFILSGKLKVRGAVLSAGDYTYEPNGVLHGATEALEDTEYLFICNGAVLFYDDNGFTGYLSWEEIERMRQSAQPVKAAA